MVTDSGFATTDIFGWGADEPRKLRLRTWHVYESVRREAPQEKGPRNGAKHLKYRGDHRVQRKFVDVWAHVGTVRSTTKRRASNIATRSWPHYRVIVTPFELSETACVRRNEPR